MKVDLNGLTGSALDGIKSPQRTPSETAPTTSTDPTAGEDAATLSVDSARVNSLVAKALDAPDIRQDKVEALRQAVPHNPVRPPAQRPLPACWQVNQFAKLAGIGVRNSAPASLLAGEEVWQAKREAGILGVLHRITFRAESCTSAGHSAIPPALCCLSWCRTDKGC